MTETLGHTPGHDPIVRRPPPPSNPAKTLARSGISLPPLLKTEAALAYLGVGHARKGLYLLPSDLGPMGGRGSLRIGRRPRMFQTRHIERVKFWRDNAGLSVAQAARVVLVEIAEGRV